MNRIVWIALLAFSSTAAPQDAFQGNSGTATLPPDLYNAAEPAPDLRKYLSPDGRFIDTCRYWHDHPDSTTLTYGQPVVFPSGQIGETRSFNGQPAPYVRCAMNPCPPYGYMCWRNRAQPTTLSAQIQATLNAQGCEAEPNGDIYCRRNSMPHPGPPSPTLSSGVVKSVCRVIGTGISCDPGSNPNPNPNPNPSPGPGNDTFSGGGAAPSPGPKYAPLDWAHVPVCRDTGPSPGPGRVLDYYWLIDPHRYNMSWISDSRYITIGGHGAPGAPGVGGCPDRASLASVRQIATDLHRLLSLPAYANKKVRLAACESADPDPNDPKSVPTAQQLADVYREIYGIPITVEGYNGPIQYDMTTQLQSYPCRVFTSRTPLPAQ